MSRATVALLATPSKWETAANRRLVILPSSAYVTHDQHCVTGTLAAPWGSGYARDDDGTTAALDEGRFDGRCLKRRRDEQQVRRVPKASAPDAAVGRCWWVEVVGGRAVLVGGSGRRKANEVRLGLAFRRAHRGVAWQKSQRGDWMFSNNADYNKQITSFNRR